MTARDQAKVAAAVARAARFCTYEKAITVVAMNSCFSIAEVREAARA